MRCGASDREPLDQLCRCIARPASANEWVHANSAEQAMPKLKTLWRTGTTQRVMSPLEFMQRLTARATGT